MKKIFAIAMASSMFLTVSCVDNNYDLALLDRSMCILPGIEIPLGKQEVLNTTLEDFLGLPANSSKSESGALAISGTLSSEGQARMSSSQIGSSVEISVPTELVTSFDKSNPFLSSSGAGKALLNPAIVIAFTNPCDRTMTLTADISDGKTSGSFSADINPGNHNIYISAKGTSSHLKNDSGYVDVACQAMESFFSHDIPDRITVKNIKLKAVGTKSSPMTKGASEYTFTFQAHGLLDMTICAGGEFEYSTDIEIEENESISSCVFKIGDEIKLETHIEKVGIAFDIIPYITDHTNEIEVSFSPAVLPAASADMDLSAYGDVLMEMGFPTKVGIKVVIRNPGTAPISITGNEYLKFTLISLTSTNGIHIE